MAGTTIKTTTATTTPTATKSAPVAKSTSFVSRPGFVTSKRRLVLKHKKFPFAAAVPRLHRPPRLRVIRGGVGPAFDPEHFKKQRIIKDLPVEEAQAVADRGAIPNYGKVALIGGGIVLIWWLFFA